jgi:PIN domain nuclease of toxin-antitoxin system
VLAQPFEDFWRNAIDMNAFRILHVLPRHAAAVASLPFPPNHKDPFDRLIVAQAKVEGMSLVRADATLDAYGLHRIW